MIEADMKAVVDRAEGARVAYEWMRKNLHRFASCEANSQLIGEWLNKNNLPLTEENLDRAADAIGDRLARPVGEPVASVNATPTLDNIAPWPSHLPKLEIPSDIKRINTQEIRGPLFQRLVARVQAIQDGYRNPEAASVISQVIPVDDELPPVPAGLTGWPNSVDEIDAMPRPVFRQLYHSRKFGQAFRDRIVKIYEREGR